MRGSDGDSVVPVDVPANELGAIWEKLLPPGKTGMLSVPHLHLLEDEPHGVSDGLLHNFSGTVSDSFDVVPSIAGATFIAKATILALACIPARFFESLNFHRVSLRRRRPAVPRHGL